MANDKTVEERMAELEEEDVRTRVKTLEAITRRMAKASQKKISGIIFPFPIYGCSIPDEDGVIFRVMFPCDGVITRAIIDIEGVGKDELPSEIQAELRIENDVYVREFSITTPMTMVDIELPVLVGSKLKVQAISSNVEGLVWVSLLFIPEISNATIRKIVKEDQRDEGV